MNVFEKALRNAPKPIVPFKNGEGYLDAMNRLVMQYGEWYENEVLPLLRRPEPSAGAPRPPGHNPVA